MHGFSSRQPVKILNINPNLSGNEFAAILHGRISSVEVAKDTRGLIQRDLAQQQYTANEYARAKQSSRFLRKARAGDPATAAKHL